MRTRAENRKEEGYATVLAAGISAALITVCGMVTAAGMLVVNAHRAQVAADLAAVTGATAHYVAKEGCERAAHTAGLNHAELRSCTVCGADIQVEVSVGGRHATARAGPL